MLQVDINLPFRIDRHASVLGIFSLLLFFSFQWLPSAEARGQRDGTVQDQPQRVYLDQRSSQQATKVDNLANPDASKPCSRQFRMVIVEKGTDFEYQGIVYAMLRKLSEDGYLSLPQDLPLKFSFDDPQIWAKMASSSTGSCVRLLDDGLYNSHWDNDQWQENVAKLRERIRQGEVDLLVGMGLASGVEFADSTLGIPVMIVDPSSPETAGIIGPGKFSDKPNVHVQKYPPRVSISLRNYYSIFEFRRLGMIVDRDVEYQKIQSVEVVRSVADELGFDLVSCFADLHTADPVQNRAEFVRCRDWLLDKIDAFYIPDLSGAPEEHFFEYIRPLIHGDIFVFSNSNLWEVEKGSLIAQVESSFDDSGHFEADVAEQIINGTPPEKINQYFMTNLSYALNLNTARMVEWKPTFELLMSVDFLFENIDFN